MLHAPISETKSETAQSKSPLVPIAELEQHPHAFGAGGAYALNGAGSAASVRSPEAQRHQIFAGMQATHGNQAVLRMMQSPQQVARMAPLRPSQGVMLQRKCACGGSSETEGECADCKEKREAMLQRSVGNQAAPSAAPTVPPIVHDVLRSPGQPLDAGTRAFMEPRFRQDFSQVRVHTDARAAESARAVNALAYTVGRDVVFGTGQYAPGTSEGRRLMAHELTHVVQQEGHSRLSAASLAIGAQGDAFELEAQTTAERVTSRPSVSAVLTTTRRSESRATLRRQPDECPPDPQVELKHPGTCPDIKRESGELERFAALGPSVETITPGKCYLIGNLRSGSADFDTPRELNQITDLLRFDPSTRLDIVGYSDCLGSAEQNRALRLNRASEAEDYFVRRIGVVPEQIVFKAAPQTEYVDTNDDAVGRARNRSVAISISTTSARLGKLGSKKIPGLGAKKQAILNSGGTPLDIAIAMLEIKTMDVNSYPPGDNKTGDAANFGIFKQNWYMIRTSVSKYRNSYPPLTASDYKVGAALNGNLSWDIQVRHESQNYYGINLWFAGHRNGYTGLADPNTADINTYRHAVEWIMDQINSDPKYLKDNTRFSVDVSPI